MPDPTKRLAEPVAPVKGLEPLPVDDAAGVTPEKVGVNVTRAVFVPGNAVAAGATGASETDPAAGAAVELPPVTVSGVTGIPPALQLFMKSVKTVWPCWVMAWVGAVPTTQLRQVWRAAPLVSVQRHVSDVQELRVLIMGVHMD